MTKNILNCKNVKIIGRTYLDHQDVLWCGLSGTGVHFVFKGKKLVVEILGDEISKGGEKDNYCRLSIYVNGKKIIDDMLDKPLKRYTAIDQKENICADVRIIKLSESPMSSMGIMPIITQDDESIAPVEEKSRKIEFIGDSITCGYGVDDEDENHQFKTSTEDVEKAFAYKTAMSLNADYSMFSASGYGIISGYTDNGIKQPQQVIPLYYKSLGFSYGSFGGIKPQDISWDFNKFSPQLIIVNLGTNDESYCQDDSARQSEYVNGYRNFLKVVRENNPKSHIMCTLGIMGDKLFNCIETIFLQYKKETGDENISIFKFTPQDPLLDGYAANFHPTASTHTKAANQLKQQIEKIMHW